MQIRYFVALSLLPFTAMAIDAPTPGQCVIIPPVPMPAANSGSIATPDVDATHDKIIISSDSSNAIMGDMASFQGDVRVSQGDRLIKADEAVFHQQQEQLNANGNLIFQDSLFTVTADSLVAKMRQNTAVLSGANYWLHGQQVHGEAQELQITPDNNLLLKKTNFTTCPPENLTWLLEADRIKIDSEDEWGEIWDAKLKLLGVPVLYIPYMTVPVSDKRKSGLLFPSISSSTNNGLEVTTPYYWNIAPEYDLTFTPHAMTNRGLFLQTEFRYLGGEAQQGQINLGYLGDDRLLDDDPNRYMYHWQHQGAIDENWRVLANYTEVSDDNYFNDLPSDINQSTDNQLNRIGEVNYFQRNWDTSIRVQDIKVLGNENEEPYKIMPQISANYRLPDVWHNLDFAFSTELTNFEHNQDSEAKATRLHMEPSLTLPIYVPAGSLTTELKLYQTNYWQRELNQDDGLGKSVSRTIPQARIHGQINFERNTSILGNDYRQTLEPQAQYLYVGYEDQSDIGLYDTAALADDFYGLFRDSRYSSVDRIANANQVTIGATTTLFDNQNLEQLKFSLGQIFYFDDNKVTLDPEFEEETPSFSVLASELDAHLYDKWYFSGAIQFDTKEGSTKKSEFSLDFRPGTNKLIQANYRYVPDLLNTNTNNRVNISQTGLRTTWPLTDNIYFVGNWYYDLNRERTVETFTGLQYESCCWAVRLSYHYNITTNYVEDFNPLEDSREKFEKGVYLNFVIKGLGGSGPLGVSDMLDEGLFNYRKPLYLRN